MSNYSSTASASHRLTPSIFDLAAQFQAIKAQPVRAPARHSITGTVSATLVSAPAANSMPVTMERPDWLIDAAKSEGLVIQTTQSAEQPEVEAKKPQAKARREKDGSESPAPPAGGLKFDPESFEVLRYISEDFVMLTGKSLVAYHIQSGDEMCRDAFIQYSDRHYHDVLVLQPPDKEGKPVDPKRVSAGEVWWSWKNDLRRRVRRIVMEPTSKPELDDNPEVLNRWHQLKHTMAERNPKATADDIAILVNHLMYLSGGDVVGVTYFLCWLAQLYQSPEIKMPTAICMYSKYGRVGKNLMQRLISKVFGQPLVGGCTGKQLQKNFDDAIEHKRLVFINELARSEKVDGYEHFKSQVSEEFTQFEGKGRASKEIRNIAHFVVTTNHEDALPLMEGDGRIAVLRCLAPRQSDEYYKELVAWIDGPGAPAMAQILATWKFPAGWNPHAPVPQTAAARAMQKASRDELEVLLAELTEAGTVPCDKDIIIVDDLCAQVNTLFGNSLTRRANRTSAGKALQAIGAEFCEKRIEIQGNSTPRKHYVIRNKEQWANATPKQRGEHLNTGVRLFAVQPSDDHLNTEGEAHD